MEFCVPSQGPHREDIAIGGVRDSTRAIEDAGYPFLIPVPITQLFTHQVADGAIDGAVFVSGS